MTKAGHGSGLTGPLDRSALLGLRAHRRDLGALRVRIEAHLDQHEGYVPFSGGKDSLVVLSLARAVDPEVPVVFFDSGLEFPETYAYVNDLAAQWRLNLQVIPSRVPLLERLARSGGWSHTALPVSGTGSLHEDLIAAPAARAHQAFGAGELWGVRAAEARGRAAAYGVALRRERRRCGCTCVTEVTARRVHGGVIRRADGTVAYGPVWDWPTAEVWGHIGRHRLPVNPVYDKLRRLGAPEPSLRISHMLDGSHLDRGHATWLRRGWPSLFEELAQVLPRLREYV